MAALQRAGVEMSRSRLRKSFDAGGVRLDGKVMPPAHVVEVATSVEVSLIDAPVLRAEPEALPLAILHEDDVVLVVDKAAPMVVHPSVGHERGTLVGAVLHHLGLDADALPVLPGNDATRPGIVHRLDRDTSGVIVVAKTGAAQTFLARQFEAHTIERSYVAVVDGVPSWTALRVDTTHARDPLDRRRFAPGGGGRRALTDFAVMEALRDAAVVRCTLHTGRTHQIRMHARHVDHPVYGDHLYGRAPKEVDQRALWNGLTRHALHAEVLAFDHPNGERMRFTSALAPELTELITALR